MSKARIVDRDWVPVYDMRLVFCRNGYKITMDPCCHEGHTTVVIIDSEGNMWAILDDLNKAIDWVDAQKVGHND